MSLFPYSRPSVRYLRGLALLLVVGLIACQDAADSPPPAPEVDSELQAAANRIIEAARSSDVAYDTLAELCDDYGHRLSGSPQLEAAIDWSAAKMREFGLENVRKEEVLVPTWIRGSESGRILEPGPHELSLLGLGRSVGTRSGGVTAEVLVVESFDAFELLTPEEVQGKIVLWNAPYEGYGATVGYRSRGASTAARKGAVATLVRSVGFDGLQTPHTGALRYDDDAPQIPAAAVSVEDALLMERLAARGQRIVVQLEMEARTAPDAISYNVIGEIVGRELPDEVVVVGGHIDSWDVGQGAQDDGAGCMMSLEAVRLLHALDLRPRRTVRVVWWTNEENGLRGGQAYHDRYLDALGQHVAALETDSGNGLANGFRFDLRAAAVGGEQAGEAALESARQRGKTILEKISPLLTPLGGDQIMLGGSGADISPLARSGVPCLGLNHDTSEYFRIHHTAADTFDKIIKADLDTNTAILAVMVYALAEIEETLQPVEVEATPTGR